MIKCIFTLDYEIYGNGAGSLEEFVYIPGQRLQAVFNKYYAPLVLFVEPAELEIIEANNTDSAIKLVKTQVKSFHCQGHEVGLHLHPQWFNAINIDGEWQLDYSEYNLCVLPRNRIIELTDRSIKYLRTILESADFSPFSFRAGNMLLQPAKTVVEVLSERGIQVDSSVYKGGLLNEYGIDYRPSLNNGYFWQFSTDPNHPDSVGSMLEFPIYTKMSPLWNILSTKRIKTRFFTPKRKMTFRNFVSNTKNYLRPLYPIKLDFCNLTIAELKCFIDFEIKRDSLNPDTLRPIVSIGHTKDVRDVKAIDFILAYLRDKGIEITTFRNIAEQLKYLWKPLEETINPQIVNNSSISREHQRLTYALITAARNEANFIARTIDSVIGQSVLPLKWIIVSDGSSDGTDEIVRHYATSFPWIELIRMPARDDRHFGGKARAVNEAFSLMKSLRVDIIGNLDADVILKSNHFSSLLDKFIEDPRLGVAGFPFREGDKQYDYRITRKEHVSGACQLFRRNCFEAVGGYPSINGGGIDLVAVVTARMKGWKTRTFTDSYYIHLRPMGRAQADIIRYAIKFGYGDYMLGVYPIWALVRSLYQMTRKPFFIDGFFVLIGYLKGMITRPMRPVSVEFVHFRKSEQLEWLKDYWNRLLKFLS